GFCRRPGRRATAGNGDAVRRQPRHVCADRKLQVGPGACTRDPGAARPMTGGAFTLATAPLLPWTAIGLLAGACALVLGFGLLRRAPGLLWRAIAVAILLVTLVNPSVIEEQRSPQRDIAIVIVDDSPSQRIGDRQRATEAALAALKDRLSRERDLDLRVIRAGRPQPGAGDDGTKLFTALDRAMSDVPRQRLAGVVMITDGQVHDVPTGDASALKEAVGAPLHVLLSGRPDEGDRRLVVDQAPSFGLVGKELKATIRVEDLPESAPKKQEGGTAQARVTWRKDGGTSHQIMVPIDRDVPLAVPIDHGGPNVVELEVEPGPQELTLENNRSVVVVNGVRDRLRVLLISGEPDASERVWRDLLKSDPSVDLVHFTILRPPAKQAEDPTPINELSLIVFPTPELFGPKLDRFDLVIFDRYSERGILLLGYYENIARYVENGGALLVSAGPEFAGPTSIFRTPLASVLPARPTGDIIAQGFKPMVTPQGLAHPVTRDLTGENTDGKEPSWGRWFRIIGAEKVSGETLMSGPNDRPLLVLDRVGKGRVAELLSDQIWLWARGFEGGGPQAELLRKFAHWLMKEPELEEERLSASIDSGLITVERQTMADQPKPVTLTYPSGKQVMMALAKVEPGMWRGAAKADQLGLYRLTDGTLNTVTATGPLNPKEVADMRAT